MSFKIAYNTKAEGRWNPKHVATFQNHITLSVHGHLRVIRLLQRVANSASVHWV